MFKEYKEIADNVGWSGAAGSTNDVRSAVLKYCETYSKKCTRMLSEKVLEDPGAEGQG